LKSINEVVLNIRQKGSWKNPIFDFIDDYNRDQIGWDLSEPDFSGLSPEVSSLVCGVVAYMVVKYKANPPKWTKDSKYMLKEPFFVSGLENFKANALVHSPLQLRRLNVFVTEDFFSRV